jgi:hypothetical protein
VLLALAPAAHAATPKPTKPGVKLAPAAGVTTTTATLRGTVNPGGAATTAVFQYGTTKRYGGQTHTFGLPADRNGHNVSVTVTNLAPGTQYHFRLAATNSVGTTFSGDRGFRTQAPDPNAATIAVRPNPVKYGHAVRVSGVLGGPGHAGVAATLEGRPSPFTAPFAPLAGPTSTGPNGAYSFVYLLGTNADLHVVTATARRTTSPNARVGVAMNVRLHLPHRARRGRAVRVSGVVRPSAGGGFARLEKQNVRNGKWFTKARISLQQAGDHWTFARRVHLSASGRFRASVDGDADHVGGSSSPRRLRFR